MELIIVGVILAIILLSLWRHYKKTNTIYIDCNGYERNGYHVLIHRKVAYKYIYSYPEYLERFGSYDIHHIDRDKRNNSPNNLQILTREEHKAEHGI